VAAVLIGINGLAVALAAAGVLHLTLAYGTLPWIASGLSLSFGSYGLVKKKAPLPPLEGLTLETAIQFAPAMVYLLILQRNGEGAFLRTGAPTIQFLLGVFVFHEAFSWTQLVGFSVVWMALAVFTIDGVRASRPAGAFAVPDHGAA
jgi:chloramphenicol-sensitive protein RarD